jgi:hypothetical protein
MSSSLVARPTEGKLDRWRSVAASHPHLALTIAVVAGLATEPIVDAGRDASSFVGASSAAGMLVARALVAGACLFVAWDGQQRLRLGPVLACGAALGLGWILVHQLIDVAADKDLQIYAATGSSLLDGTYPGSEYPTGAVLLFAAEHWVGGDHMRVVHAVAMVGFHLATVGAIWSVRSTWAPWLAAFVAVWPMNAFHWEFRYDLAPTALLAVGLALALRGRWGLSGVALGIGTALKWVPGLAFLVLVVWLSARHATRSVLVLGGGFVATLALLTVPFLLWEPDHVLDAYRRQGDRGIIGESVWYLPLAVVGVARSTPGELSVDLGVSPALDTAATVIQVVIVLALLFLAWRLRDRRHAVALAALTPAAFLLTNRVFSSQFFVVLLAMWALAAALVVRSAGEQLAVGAGAGLAASANAMVHPYNVWFAWEAASAILFALAIVLTTWLVWRTVPGDRAARSP